MCMEDVKIGRDSLSQFKTVALPNGAEQLLVPGDPDRIAISFGGNAASILYFRPTSLGAVPGGFTWASNVGILNFNIYQHGRIVTEPWYAFVAAAAQIASVITMNLKER